MKELLISAIASAATLTGAYYKNFFSLPTHKRKMAVSWRQLLTAFGLFVLPWLLIGTLFQKSLYAGFIAFSVSMVAFVFYLQKCSKATRHDVLTPFSQDPSRYSFGALSWIIAFPVSLFVGLSINKLLGLPKLSEQIIAQQILALKPYPLLFGLTIFAVVLLVPMIEELLFRGFLYNCLKNKLPRYAASLITALLFTAAHYSPALGVGNVEILSALFVLALFLNHVYEKGGNILAPIALHQTFNCISLVLLLSS